MTIELAGRTGSYRPPAAGKWQPTHGMRKTTAVSIRKLAGKVREDHPDMGSHRHLRDAADALDRNQPESALRHLTAAVNNMTPQSLHRHGLVTDDHHAVAKGNMDSVHRHILLVKDIQDTQARNQELISRTATEDNQGEPVDRGASQPGDLAQRPTSRQPGNTALNAPNTTNSGGPDPNAARPKAVTTWNITKQIAASSDLPETGIDLAYNSSQPRDAHGRWSKDFHEGFPGTESGRELARGHAYEKLTVNRLVGEQVPVAAKGAEAKAGTREHAEELRQLAREADLSRGRNYTALRGSAEGVASYAASKVAAGTDPWGPGESDLSRVLRRSASMIDRGQPSLARLHAGSIRDLAQAEAKGNPLFAARLRVTAGKLDSLPSGTGMARQPPVNRDVLTRTRQARAYARRPAAVAASNDYLFSAETARLAVTPAPRGRPGGPGLYHVKGMGHTAYLQQIVKALIEKRGMPSGKAYAIARGSIRRWSRGGGHVHPEVRAAAGAAESGELARQARAHAHANASSPARVIALSGDAWRTEERAKDGQWTGALSDLADKIDREHPGKGIGDDVRRARDAARSGDRNGTTQHLKDAQAKFSDHSFYAGGRGDATYLNAVGNSHLIGDHIKHASWTEMSMYEMPALRRAIELTGTAAGAQKDQRTPKGQPGGGQFGAGKGGQQKQPTAHQKHVAHMAHVAGQNRAKTKAGLIATAKADRAKAYALERQRAVMQKALASASGRVSRGQAGSTTRSTATTKTSAPVTATTATASGTAPARTGTASRTPKTAAARKVQLRAQIAQLNTQINALLAAAAKATAQAAKL